MSNSTKVLDPVNSTGTLPSASPKKKWECGIKCGWLRQKSPGILLAFQQRSLPSLPFLYLTSEKERGIKTAKISLKIRLSWILIIVILIRKSAYHSLFCQCLKTPQFFCPPLADNHLNSDFPRRELQLCTFLKAWLYLQLPSCRDA